MVNCTSSEDDLVEMYWKLGNTEKEKEDEKYFISQLVTLSDWNVKAECKIRLNDSFECSKDLQITIYSKWNFKLI